jgi:hypothetical protein
VERRVDVDHPDDRVPVPQRRAHRGPNLLHPDRLTRLEPLVLLGVGGQHRDFLADHHVDDRARVRKGPVGRHPLPRLEAADAEPKRVLLLEEEEAPVDRQVLEDQVHDLVEHRLQVVQGNQRLCDLHEDLEDLVLVRDVEDDALPVRRGLV